MIRSSKILVLLASTIVCITSASVQAQYNGADQGQYQILHARYGTERNNIDVTDRLRQLARRDLVFRMGNSTFGTDPDHGRIKTLRIYTRGPNGESRMFEYREGSTVDGSMFTGWRGGNWGNGEWRGGWEGPADSGQYQILHARYGTERNNVDVTDRLRQLAQQDLVFRMGNSTFGIDPDPGYIKTLRIYTRGPNGEDRMFEYRESSTIDGSTFTGWRGGNWGNGEWRGGWSGRQGDRGDRDYRDDRSSRGDSGQYRILHARYGTERNNIDVTERLRQLARQDLVFRMGNSTFGVDPDHGRIKTLRIYTRGPNGEDRMFEYREGSTVDGSIFTGWRTGDWAREEWRGGWGK